MWVMDSGGALLNMVEDAFGRQRYVDLYERKSRLVYKESSWLHSNIVSKKNVEVSEAGGTTESVLEGQIAPVLRFGKSRGMRNWGRTWT